MNEERVRASLLELDRFEAPPLQPSVVARVRRRRAARMVGAAGATLALALGAVAAYAALGTGGDPARPLTPAGTQPSCSEEVWACGDEARWLRRVAEDAAWTFDGHTGSAIALARGAYRVQAWAFEIGEGTGIDPGYRPWEPASRLPIAVGSDGVRLVWSVHGLALYLSNADEGTIADLDPEAVIELIRATHRNPPEDVPQVAESYPLVYIDDDLRVFAPAGPRKWGWCPAVAEMPTTPDLQRLRDAMAAWASTSHEAAFRDIEVVKVVVGDVFDSERERCGEEVSSATAVVDLFYPKMMGFSASLGQARIYAVKQPRGWVLWFNY